MKQAVRRKIAQNQKWNRKFERLLHDIEDYEKRPGELTTVRILEQCASLHILAEG